LRPGTRVWFRLAIPKRSHPNRIPQPNFHRGRSTRRWALPLCNDRV